jgi:hypothetical protein
MRRECEGVYMVYCTNQLVRITHIVTDTPYLIVLGTSSINIDIVN